MITLPLSERTPFILNRNLLKVAMTNILDQFQVIYEDVVKETFLDGVLDPSESSPTHYCALLNLIIRAKPMTLTFLSQAATDP